MNGENKMILYQDDNEINRVVRSGALFCYAMKEQVDIFL